MQTNIHSATIKHINESLSYEGFLMKKFLIHATLATLAISSVVYADDFEAGVAIQRSIIDSIELVQQDGNTNTQAANNVTASGMANGAFQTHSGDEIDMDQTGGTDSTQAVNNVDIDGGAFAGSYQSTTADEATMTQSSGKGNTQAINNANIK